MRKFLLHSSFSADELMSASSKATATKHQARRPTHPEHPPTPHQPRPRPRRCSPARRRARTYIPNPAPNAQQKSSKRKSSKQARHNLTHTSTCRTMPTGGTFKQLVASLRGRAPDAETRSTQLDAFEALISAEGHGTQGFKNFRIFRDNSRK